MKSHQGFHPKKYVKWTEIIAISQRKVCLYYTRILTAFLIQFLHLNYQKANKLNCAQQVLFELPLYGIRKKRRYSWILLYINILRLITSSSNCLSWFLTWVATKKNTIFNLRTKSFCWNIDASVQQIAQNLLVIGYIRIFIFLLDF